MNLDVNQGFFMLKNSVRSITSLLDVNSVYKKFNNKIENVNGFSFAFFYISKFFKINKLMDVR